MNIIPVITSRNDLFEQVSQAVSRMGESEGPPLQCIRLADPQTAIDHLQTEMPDLVILDFSDPGMEVGALLESILGDPWLLSGALIGLCADSKESKRLEEVKGANFVSTLTPGEIDGELPKVLRILRENTQIMVQRSITTDLTGNLCGTLVLDNDLLEANCCAHLVTNYLFNLNRIDADEKTRLYISIYELLINAIEHGNLSISYEEKSAWLANHRSINPLIQQKCADPAIGRRKVTFEYAIMPSQSRFTITDEGAGFDWRNVKDALAEENLLAFHGRGILMAREFTSNLQYNERGNQVSFEVQHSQDLAPMTPGLLKDLPAVDVPPGEIVFREGEPSSFLYYIAKGTYEVSVKERVVSTLTPNDVFMGEMSFLTSNRRSATVQAITHGRLIRVSKRDFVAAIKRKPHYALFLSRLLAQRIERANLQIPG